MIEHRPYSLTILVHPQASPKEREEAESLVRTWIEQHEGTIAGITHEQKRRLAYPVHHVHQATHTMVRFHVPAGDLTELREKLRRQKKILRFRIFKGPPRGETKTLKDLPPRTAASEATRAPVKKDKAPLKDLDEKIEEILGEQVL